MGETLNPDAGTETRERKISSTRTQNYQVRRSRAMIERGMTPAMLQSERDIALGWALRVGGASLSASDFERVRGGVSMKDIDQERMAVIRLLDWMTRCNPLFREIVLDLAVHAKALGDIAAARRISRQTVIRRFHSGLIAYGEMCAERPKSSLAEMKWHQFKKAARKT